MSSGGPIPGPVGSLSDRHTTPFVKATTRTEERGAANGNCNFDTIEGDMAGKGLAKNKGIRVEPSLKLHSRAVKSGASRYHHFAQPVR